MSRRRTPAATRSFTESPSLCTMHQPRTRAASVMLASLVATACATATQSPDAAPNASGALPPPVTVQPWQYALPTEDQLKRNPATLIPPQFRPRVALRFDAQNTLLVSGLLDGGADIAQRPVVVDVPVGKGHAVLFANNPIWRGETIGSYFMVFNAILNFDNLDAGRVLDAR